MENYTIFHIEGGLGKHIAATAVAKTIKNNYPDRKLIVVCGYPEIFINLPYVYRVYRIGDTPYFYDNYIKDKKSLIFKHEPYFTSEHINGELPLIQNWCKLHNLNYNNEQPELIFNQRQVNIFSNFWYREKPIMVIQTNGGPLTQQPYPYSWTRDMPKQLAKYIVDYYKKDYHIIQICRNEVNFLEGVEVCNQQLTPMELIYLLNMSKKRILIDSCLQHAAKALNLPSVVLWVGTNPDLFGYKLHSNIKANLRKEIQLIDSYLFDYNFNGDVRECPIFEGDVLFNINEIFTEIENNN